jgi:hypothetical protein
MDIFHNLWMVAAAVLLLNLPFGFWRASVRKFSLPWILAVHFPVPCVIALRILSGLGWQLRTFPVMVGAFFTGQFLGGRMRGWWRGRNYQGANAEGHPGAGASGS